MGSIKLFTIIWFHAMLGLYSTTSIERCTEKELRAERYLQKISWQLNEEKNVENLAAYNYNINVTEENRKRFIDVSAETSKLFKEKATEILDRGYQFLENEAIKRQVKILTNLEFQMLPEEEFREAMDAISKMQTNYAKVKICEYKNPSKCDMTLEPDIEKVITESRNPEELEYYWKEWYDKAGTPVRSDFLKYLEMSEKASKLNGFETLADDWIDKYDDPNFVDNLDRIYQEILPLYKQLHGYVRYRLRQRYGDIIPVKGNLPIHLLGNLWGQSWDDIIDLLTPYPDKPFYDVTEEMIRQKYTPLKIFQMGDEFFQSLNMTKLPESFWNDSVLEKPSDGRDIICHASAWDMFLIDDVRIKQCTEVNMQHLYVAHHELGHIQYYLQYQEQLFPFRRAPNPGFHEAVGDVLALSVSTPKHLEKIGLLKDFHMDKETRINQLFKSGLAKIVFLPFAYTLDKYRWSVFRREINESELNCAFWRMRSKYSGLEPPVERTETDFDPTAKYHVCANVEYLRYFASHIFEFQFFKSACMKAGQYVPGDLELTLDNCDIYDSSEAGNAFKAMLSLGASKPWPDALETFTGERIMSAAAFLEYFEPLRAWLESENEKLQIPIGWTETEKCKG